MAYFTKNFHRRVYPAVEPSQFDCRDKTVLVCGISSEIGQGIAGAFVAAHAQRVIVTGRSDDSISKAINRIKAATANTIPSETELIGHQCDLANSESISSLWSSLRARDILVDTMVLVAVDATGGLTLKDAGRQRLRTALDINLHGPLEFVDHFTLQGSQRPKTIINISTAAVHTTHKPGKAAYSLSQLAFAYAMQELAFEQPAEQLYIVNVHPSIVMTESVRAAGYTEDMSTYNNAALSGAFCVWASSPLRTPFLHGRFLWANWDVRELLAMRDDATRFGNAGFLRLGLQGIEPVTMEHGFPANVPEPVV